MEKNIIWIVIAILVAVLIATIIFSGMTQVFGAIPNKEDILDIVTEQEDEEEKQPVKGTSKEAPKGVPPKGDVKGVTPKVQPKVQPVVSKSQPVSLVCPTGMRESGPWCIRDTCPKDVIDQGLVCRGSFIRKPVCGHQSGPAGIIRCGTADETCAIGQALATIPRSDDQRHFKDLYCLNTIDKCPNGFRYAKIPDKAKLKDADKLSKAGCIQTCPTDMVEDVYNGYAVCRPKETKVDHSTFTDKFCPRGFIKNGNGCESITSCPKEVTDRGSTCRRTFINQVVAPTGGQVYEDPLGVRFSIDGTCPVGTSLYPFGASVYGKACVSQISQCPKGFTSGDKMSCVSECPAGTVAGKVGNVLVCQKVATPAAPAAPKVATPAAPAVKK